MYIQEIKAREILDSRGNPTIETKVILSEESSAVASVPSGASIGKLESLELRDKDYSRYEGLGVLRAVENVNKVIAPNLYKKNPTEQIDIDKLLNALDGTANKAHLGANAVLSVSLAVARATATAKKTPLYEYLNLIYQRVNKAMFEKGEQEGLEAPATKKMSIPTPVFSLINGGKHAQNNLSFEEFLLIPIDKSKGFAEQLRAGAEIDHQLKEILKKHGYDVALGDEGGFAPNLDAKDFAPNVGADQRALELIIEAIRKNEHWAKKKILPGLDLAASSFYEEGKHYVIPGEKRQLKSKDMVKFIIDLFKKYPIFIIEDGLAESDWAGWEMLTKELENKALLVGDDLFTTNIKRLKEGVERKVANAIVIKPNQVGTLVETLQTIIYAQQNNYAVMMAHRSGETNDTFIADLAVAVGADFIKSGAPVRGERVAKYNRLLEIASEIEGGFNSASRKS